MSYSRLTCSTYSKANTQRHHSRMKIPNQKQILSKNKPGSKSQRAIDANITNTLNTVSKAVIESVHKTQQYMKPSDLLSMDIAQEKIDFLKWQNKEIISEIKRLSQHLIALVDINQKECTERDKIYQKCNPKNNEIESTILKFVEIEHKKLSEQLTHASNTKLVVQLKLRDKELDSENEALLIRKKQLEISLKYEKRAPANDFSEESAMQCLSDTKEKLETIKGKLNKMYSSPVKKDTTKYNYLLDECATLGIDISGNNNERVADLKEKEELKKDISANIANIEGKIRLAMNDYSKKEAKQLEQINTLTTELSQLERKALELKTSFTYMMNSAKRSPSPKKHFSKYNKVRVVEHKLRKAALIIQKFWKLHHNKHKHFEEPKKLEIPPAEQSGSN